MTHLTLAILGLDSLCKVIVGAWNSLVIGINALMGILLDPLGFLWWIIGNGLIMVSKILPDIPDEMTLAGVANNIGQATGIGTGLIKELMGIVSQFLVIVAIIKIYKLIPFKMS